MIRRRKLAALVAAPALMIVAACGSGDGSPSEPEPTRSREFSVLAYNVAGLPQGTSSSNPRVNIPLISPLLNPYDIVLTQEDFDWWVPLLDAGDFANYHNRLRSRTTHAYATERHPGPAAVGIDVMRDRPQLFVGDGLGILSRFPFRNVQRVPWKSCYGGTDTRDGGAADCLAMKGFAVGTFTLADAVEVDVYTLHMEAGQCRFDQALQADDIDHLAAFMGTHSPRRAVIIGGDTNLHTESTHPDACDGADTVLWSNFLARTRLTDVCDALSCSDREAIDKMAFRSGGGVALTALTWRFETATFVDPNGQPLSDHRPLHVDFRYTVAE